MSSQHNKRSLIILIWIDGHITVSFIRTGPSSPSSPSTLNHLAHENKPSLHGPPGQHSNLAELVIVLSGFHSNLHFFTKFLLLSDEKLLEALR